MIHIQRVSMAQEDCKYRCESSEMDMHTCMPANTNCAPMSKTMCVWTVTPYWAISLYLFIVISIDVQTKTLVTKCFCFNLLMSTYIHNRSHIVKKEVDQLQAQQHFQIRRIWKIVWFIRLTDHNTFNQLVCQHPTLFFIIFLSFCKYWRVIMSLHYD